MNPALPVVDDTLVWNDLLSIYRFPAISVALELGLFEALAQSADDAAGLAARLLLSQRGLEALLPMLAIQGYLARHGGQFQLSEAGRSYLLKDSPFYWGHVFTRLGKGLPQHQMLLENLRGDEATAGPPRRADGWESGHVELELAREVTAFMHSHSMPAAVGLARLLDLSDVNRLLDVGGGSGCYAIALARANPALQCTVMELPTICLLADDYIAAAGMSERVDSTAVDMFRQRWPRGYDALFFANVFHDWTPQTCAELAAKAFEVLPAGGRILLHEMLLDDDRCSPPPAVAFSLMMAGGTKGQQFSFSQLQALLWDAGFSDIACRPSYGYYALVSACKA